MLFSSKVSFNHVGQIIINKAYKISLYHRIRKKGMGIENNNLIYSHNRTKEFNEEKGSTALWV